jgi:quercetin dioxygenase-like cupin family protein
MTMSRLKLIAAGAFFGCSLVAVVIKTAWATPGQGISTTIVSSAAVGETHLSSKSDINEVKIKTKGESDVYVVRNAIVPGGHTGWHTHPGPSIISVASGTVTEYRSDEPEGIVHEAGSVFVDEGGDHGHIMVNEGTVDLVLVAFQVLPAGAPRRIDLPAP